MNDRRHLAADCKDAFALSRTKRGCKFSNHQKLAELWTVPGVILILPK